MTQIQYLIDQDARRLIVNSLRELEAIVANNFMLSALSVEGLTLLEAIRRAVEIVNPADEKDWNTMEQQLKEAFNNSNFGAVLCDQLRSRRDQLTKEFYEKVKKVM